jgi:hypothetical protein
MSDRDGEWFGHSHHHAWEGGMPKALILYQDQQFSDVQVQLLDDLLKRLYRAHVDSTRLLTIWNRIPAGQAFTNYRDSRSSLVTLECPNGFPQRTRVVMLKALDEEWRSITQQHPEQLMLALVEKDMFSVVYQSNRTRLSVGGQLKFAWHIVQALLRAWRRRTPLIVNPNL